MLDKILVPLNTIDNMSGVLNLFPIQQTTNCNIFLIFPRNRFWHFMQIGVQFQILFTGKK